ncbi:hypothetical protein NPIL_597901 [Nephila pilipes]|uniref:Uncharacterized protein n=1 Tax=Nephila pilipes TaxID=299642 RepID=A0A8X6TXQ4_NEPPI|nr:hypothetical protein NPIL_597901 [Nephila pilipes]
MLREIKKNTIRSRDTALNKMIKEISYTQCLNVPHIQLIKSKGNKKTGSLQLRSVFFDFISLKNLHCFKEKDEQSHTTDNLNDTQTPCAWFPDMKAAKMSLGLITDGGAHTVVRCADFVQMRHCLYRCNNF